jgi:hypothetical protein
VCERERERQKFIETSHSVTTDRLEQIYVNELICTYSADLFYEILYEIRYQYRIV